MNVKRTSSLRTLAALLTLRDRCAVTMTPTEEGFLLTRADTDNATLRNTLTVNARNDGIRFVVCHAWACGEDGRGGLHVMGV